MWIAPNGKVLILSGVPVDNSYTDVPWFESKGAQSSYFQGFLLSGQSYSKVGFMRTNTKLPATSQWNTSTPRDECTIRVPTNASNLYTANYLMFQNTAYSDKWFYAFVKRVNPLSDNATEIEYELDEIQTWMFDFEIGACMVEREHIIKSDDKIGANTVPENYNGEKIKHITESYTVDPVTALITVSNEDGTSHAPNPFANNGFVTGAEITGYTSQTELVNAINGYVDKKNISAILSAVCCSFAPSTSPETKNCQTLFYSFPPTAGLSSTLAFSQVKNKKLLTKQFASIHVETSDGSEIDWDIEGFADPENISFEIGSGGLPWNWIISPKAYYNNKGTLTNKLSANLSVSIPFGGSDFAITTGLSVLKVVTNIVGGALTGAKYGAKGAAIGAGAAAIKGTASIAQAAFDPQRSSGVGSNPDGLIGGALQNKQNGVYYGVKAITADEAKSMDEYFTYYGYATDEYKVPNGLYSNKRSVFNYVKTEDCMLKSCKCPVESAQKIKECFNKGIRLWHDTSKIGTKVEDND